MIDEGAYSRPQAAGTELPEAGLTVAPSGEPGMNFISADFDLIMVNRTNERLYGKSAAYLLGKKCYREFERREQPCAHCPGHKALATGETHETDAVAWHQDGTRLYVRIRAHPVLGPDNTPTGFIEVVEDLTEQRRSEIFAGIETDLQTALVSAKNIPRALRELLEATLRLESIDWGCVFQVDRNTGQHELVHQRGLSAAQVELLHKLSRGEPRPAPEDLPGGSQVLEVVPILHRGSVTAVLVAGGFSCKILPSALKVGLRSLGVLAGNAISRILAEQSRGDAVADLEAFIAIAPVATWVLDAGGRVTMWNKAAERVLGWPASEILGSVPRFAAAHTEAQPVKIACKDGRVLDMRLVAAPFRDVVGNASTSLVMAELLCPASSETGGVESSIMPANTTAPDGGADSARGKRVLVFDAGEAWGTELGEILAGLGYAPTRCASTAEATGLLAEADAKDEPFSLAVVAMIYLDGSSGLDRKSKLRGLGLKSPIMVSSDSGVHGHEHYGIASVITQPYTQESVAKAVDAALR